VNDSSRRAFLNGAGALGACLLCSCAGNLADQSRVNVAGAPVEIGAPARFTREGIYSDWAQQGFFVVRAGKALYALSAICTHKHYALDEHEGKIVCDHHGSIFERDGTVTKGPARLALPRMGIGLLEGNVVVDPTRRLDAGDPAASLSLA
jgi:Rieske Fe-S protein